MCRWPAARSHWLCSSPSMICSGYAPGRDHPGFLHLPQCTCYRPPCSGPWSPCPAWRSLPESAPSPHPVARQAPGPEAWAASPTGCMLLPPHSCTRNPAWWHSPGPGPGPRTGAAAATCFQRSQRGRNTSGTPTRRKACPHYSQRFRPEWGAPSSSVAHPTHLTAPACAPCAAGRPPGSHARRKGSGTPPRARGRPRRRARWPPPTTTPRPWRGSPPSSP